MTAYVHAVTDFNVQHPNWAGLLVFLMSAAEAIAIIGSIVPGTTILIGVGAVVGLGHQPLGPILNWATLGTIFGYGASYWLGHRYHHLVVPVWPFSRRPHMRPWSRRSTAYWHGCFRRRCPGAGALLC